MENTSKTKCGFVHAGLRVSSEANARAVFEDLFGLERVKSFEAGADLMNNLFHVDKAVTVIVYQARQAAVEVFVAPDCDSRTVFDHICIESADRAAVMESARGMGFEIRAHARPDGSEIIFIKDTDGNLYEIKEAE